MKRLLPRSPLRFPLGIRGKVLALSLVLLAIPWLGYLYILEMESLLREGHVATVQGTARAVAIALQDRRSLFDPNVTRDTRLSDDGDLYVGLLPNTIKLDGVADEWPASAEERLYADQNLIEAKGVYSPLSLSFRHRLGQQGKFVYHHLAVADEQIIYRPQGQVSLEHGDHVMVAMVTPQGELRRYVFSPTGPGWVTANVLALRDGKWSAEEAEPRIKGVWRETEQGYALEFRVPFSLVGKRLAIAAADVDDRDIGVNALVGTAGINKAEQLGTVMIPTPEIEAVLQGFRQTASRVWVVDRSSKVQAQAGSLKRNRPPAVEAPAVGAVRRFLGEFERTALRPLYGRILSQPREDFQDEWSSAKQLQGKEIEQALDGVPGVRRRPTPDGLAVVISAAHPIWVGEEILGVVVVEETTNAVVALTNRALERLITLTLAISLFGSAALFLFASRISSRIRRLRDEADLSIDSHGRVTGRISDSQSHDEIGDLSRSFAQALDKLKQYTSYLENLATRLSHEMRTPIAVVRSSLDNLRMQNLPDDARVYMDRAADGLSRLHTVLTRMTEATRMEHTLQQAERERFDLGTVLVGCIEGYRSIYPGQRFAYRGPNRPVRIEGAPDLIAQMLDKLVANAADFALEGTPIEIELASAGREAEILVANQGPPLPESMQGNLFQSMVSVRSGKAGKSTEPHLGLGLYIVRLITEFHGGRVGAANRRDLDGVVMRVQLPLASNLG